MGRFGVIGDGRTGCVHCVAVRTCGNGTNFNFLSDLKRHVLRARCLEKWEWRLRGTQREID